MPTALLVSEKTRLRRHPERGSYDRDLVHAILDEALVCHVGFSSDQGPVVIPTTFARVGETLYLHGSRASHLLGALARGAPLCLTVTLLDGLVLARSAMHHSMNFRSVVLYATAREVSDESEKRAALVALVDHVLAGRASEVREPSAAELRATLVVAVPIAEASAKVRSGPPLDSPEDLALPSWAGVLPVELVPAAPEPDPTLAPAVPLPDSVRSYLRQRRRPSAASPVSVSAAASQSSPRSEPAES